MTTKTTHDPLLDMLLGACASGSRSGALTIQTELAPSSGVCDPVSPPTMAPREGQNSGPRWQTERRWMSPSDEEPRTVVMLDQPQSQRQRIGAALETTAADTGMPLIVMDFSALDLPAHIHSEIAHVRWPHRTADAYAYDSMCGGSAFKDHPVGNRLLYASADEAEALIAWFPTAAAFGFWHSNLGSKGHSTRLAGSFHSEIVGWDPAVGDEPVVRKGLKGDAMNITKGSHIERADKDDRLAGWDVADKGVAPSEMGMGQIPYGEGPRQSLRPVSFRRITQTAVLVFSQIRRLSIAQGAAGHDGDKQDAAARALVAALVVHGYETAFGAPFALRSGCALTPQATTVSLDAEPVSLPADTTALVRDAASHARACGVSLDGWDRKAPLRVTPNKGLTALVARSWPQAGGEQ